MRVIITGANGTLGQALATAFTTRGDNVAGLVRNTQNPSASTKLKIPCFSVSDLADATAAVNAMAQAVHVLGGLDVLVNTAGAYAWEMIEAGRFETWQRMFDANVKTALATSLAALPHLATGGSIINVGTASAEPATTGTGAYAAAKSAVARLTESLAAELKPRAIRVNAILPGIIDTPLNRLEMPGVDPDTWVKANAIADVVLFLASDAARAISGALIPLTCASHS